MTRHSTPILLLAAGLVALLTACSRPAEPAADAPPAASASASAAPLDGDGEAADPAAAEATAQLRSLPYGRWVPVAADDARQGVVIHDPRAWPGLNLFNPRYLTRAFLVDMDGRTVYQWSLPDEERDGFHHIEPTADGGLVALIKNHRIVRLDAASHVVWSRDLPVHHDVALTADGGLWVPTRHRRWVEHGGDRLPLVEDRLTRLGADGQVRREIRLWDLFGRDVRDDQWQAIRDWVATMEDRDPAKVIARAGADSPADVFHTNSVEILRRPVPGLGERGDLLISIRQLDTVAVVDPRSGAIRWRWGPGELDHQHQPSVTRAGTVLIFDNGRLRRWSRVVEVDPASGAIVWQYRAEPKESFFSFSRGGAQRLPNGDTLITESDAGRVLEVTAAGEVVWELLAPLRPAADDKPPRRAAIYRLRRLPADWAGLAAAPEP